MGTKQKKYWDPAHFDTVGKIMRLVRLVYESALFDQCDHMVNRYLFLYSRRLSNLRAKASFVD